MWNYFFVATLIGVFGIIVNVLCGLSINFEFMPQAERTRKMFIFIMAVIASIIFFVGGICGMVHLHNKEADKVKAIVAEKYPDAVDFNSYGYSASVEGKFKSNGTTYEFKETKDIHGKKVLYIGQDGQKSGDSMIIDMEN